MYTTIEPRLIALLNNDFPSEPYPASPSLELPPLHDPNILKASGRPLLLEPDARKRDGKVISSSQLAPQHHALIIGGENDEHNALELKKKTGRTLGNSSPQSLRKILDDNTGNGPAQPSKKRNLVESNKDDFVQLPQPPKKQKAAKQVVPPIIIGLFEPPPQAALFPPIASSSFHDSHGRNSLNIVPARAQEVTEKATAGQPLTPATKKTKPNKEVKKNVQARKKWSEEETKALLLGVSKHGVGSWKDIIEDPGFSFNNRSAVDLKDRFRICCPEEMRGICSKRVCSVPKPAKVTSKTKFTSGLMSENILINEDENECDNRAEIDARAEDSTKERSVRTQQKKLEDLAELGIDRPFQQSGRRERKHFSEQDDREILMGYEIYGPAWAKIQRDTRFSLQTRLPTDLRDRLRNKYPDKFESKNGKDASKKAKIDARGKEKSVTSQPVATLQPSSSREGLRIEHMISSDTNIDKFAPKGQSQIPNYLLKDAFAHFSEQNGEVSEGLPFTQSFDWSTGTMTAPFSTTIGEMDISRLLLDESYFDSTVKEKPSFTDINSILTSNSESPPQVPSYLNLLASDEPM